MSIASVWKNDGHYGPVGKSRNRLIDFIKLKEKDLEHSQKEKKSIQK